VPSCRQCDVLARRCCAHILRATVLKWTAMRWTGQSMPGMGGKATGLRHDEGMAGQSTTSRANHQAPEREAPQALPCPPRHGVFYADPFLFAWMWSLYAGLETEAHRSLGYCETSSLDILAVSSSHARDKVLVGLCRCDVYPTAT
jgi:hypothetical protein